jgi:thiosulfate/3-mercaptopyruvate sulfurtransferase
MGGVLVDPDWLWGHRDDPDVLPLGSSYEGFALGHIPGAVLPVHAWLKDTPLGTRIIPPEEFAQAMESLGVTDRTTVIAYDDFDGTLAARLWWVLRYYGHDRVRVLDGGWHRWVLERRALSTEASIRSSGSFKCVTRARMACSTDELREKIAADSATVVDVRSRDEWEGTDPNYFGNKRLGRIAGAMHLDTSKLLTDDLRTLQPYEELRSLLVDAGVPADGEVVFYCQAGVAAALGVLALHALGRDNALVYEASMAEWANRDDTPMQMGARD